MGVGGWESESRGATGCCPKCPFSTQNYKICQGAGKGNSHSNKRQSIKTVTTSQDVVVYSKDFKAAIINLFLKRAKDNHV